MEQLFFYYLHPVLAITNCFCEGHGILRPDCAIEIASA